MQPALIVPQSAIVQSVGVMDAFVGGKKKLPPPLPLPRGGDPWSTDRKSARSTLNLLSLTCV